MPPTVPTLSRGAISEGTVHATGAAAARPPRARLIHSSAAIGLYARVVPRIAKPIAIPPTITLLRTRFAFHPCLIKASTSHPPTSKSVKVAHSHGTLV